jgi:hypothetical protein
MRSRQRDWCLPPPPIPLCRLYERHQQLWKQQLALYGQTGLSFVCNPVAYRPRRQHLRMDRWGMADSPTVRLNKHTPFPRANHCQATASAPSDSNQNRDRNIHCPEKCGNITSCVRMPWGVREAKRGFQEWARHPVAWGLGEPLNQPTSRLQLAESFSPGPSQW